MTIDISPVEKVKDMNNGRVSKAELAKLCNCKRAAWNAKTCIVNAFQA